MRTLRVVLSGAALASVVLVAAPQVQAAEIQSVPSLVECTAPATGSVGPPGSQGATGASGPLNFFGGPGRAAHLVRGELLPPCQLIAGLCAYPQPGDMGEQGPTGATGAPEPGPNGPGRTPHVRGTDPIEEYCAGIPSDCWFRVNGPQGPTGPVGDTGATGFNGANGPRRLVHGLTYSDGDRVILDNCTIPQTGGGSTSMLPFGLALLGVGVVAVVTGRRRRPAPLA